MGGTDNVVDQELRRRSPEHASEPVDDQQHDRMPLFQAVVEEQDPPPEGGEDEHPHADLNDAPGIEPVAERARVDGEQQERHPVGDHRESLQAG